MATQYKDGKTQNKQLLLSYELMQKAIDKDVQEVRAVIAEALTDGGINEATMDKLASIFRGYEFMKPRLDEAWERYYDHCITFDYDVKGE
jgi:hypothetical protein